MDRPQHDLKGLGLHRDQVDLLSLARPKRRIPMDAALLVKTGLLFAAGLTLAVLLSVARTALTTELQIANPAAEKSAQTE